MDGIIVLAGFVVGMLVGFTGVGGGALMTPLLVLGFGVPVLIAVGTDLLFAAITKTIGSIKHGWQGCIKWRIVFHLAIGSVPATILSLLFIKENLSEMDQLDSIMQSVLSVALMITAILLVFRFRIVKLFEKRQFKINDSFRLALTIMCGGILGVLVTLSSVGAGALGVVMLTLLYSQLKISHIIGTDIAHAVPLTAIAGLGHFHLGSVDLNLLYLLLLGSIPGVILGSHLCNRLPERFVRFVLVSVLFGVGVKLIA